MLHWFAKRLNDARKDEKGFTLIELMVVVVIIAILAAIAIPVFLGQRADAADARATANVREAALAVNLYYTEVGTNPGNNVANLAGYGFQQSDPAVAMTSANGPSNADWCVITATDGGNSAVFWMTEQDASPQGGTQAAATAAGCPNAPAP